MLLSGLVLAASEARAEQFVLFDVTFTYTKHDADNSKPSKSHYYVKGKDLNPDRPRDWTAPVDYRNGTVHIRAEVIDKPPGGAPTTWTICYIPNKGKGNGYGCTGTEIYREKGVYERDVSMTKFWENDSIIWSEGIKQMDLVIKDDSGGSGHAHKRADHEKFFPTKMRITVVQISAGCKYDPSLVPDLPKPGDKGAKPSPGPEPKKAAAGSTPAAPEPAVSTPVRVGQEAPEVVAFTPDGNSDIQAYYRNRFVLLDFWSLDDKDRARRLEALKAIRRGLAAEDRLMILSVCMDEMENHYEAWQRFLEGQGKVAYGDRDRRGPFRFLEDHKWVNVFQDDGHVATSRMYGVERTPEAFLISPDRRIRAARIPIDKLGEVIADELKSYGRDGC
jgi:hypothetical protein